MLNKLIILRDIFLNLFFSRGYELFYVVENSNWVTDCEWSNISRNINEINSIKSKVTSTHFGLRNKIIHFGSINTFITKKGLKRVHKSNKLVITWFHVTSGDERIKFVSELNQRASFVHTSCDNTRNKLVQLGVEKEKVVVVPLGVDLNLLKPGLTNDIKQFKRSLDISDGFTVVGSFQKDGEGWGRGDIPKLIKGPDVFCDVVEKLSLSYPVHILLTGPARGYVINRLTRANIKYTHVYLKRFEDIINYYQALDIYLVCSREEGGPKALLEAMACGVPLVSTKVGMAPEIVEDGTNGYLVDVGDENKIYHATCELIDGPFLRKSFIDNGLRRIKDYDYRFISKIYYEKIYSIILR